MNGGTTKYFDGCMWKFRINWREKKKKNGSGGSLLGLYGYFDGKKITRNLRKQYPDRLFWLSNTKSIPTTKRDELIV